MLLQALREEVLEANLELVRRGLVLCTFGNASGFSREDQLVVITHADYFHGPVPVPADMTDQEIVSAYEKNTGDAIVPTFEGADWRGSCRRTTVPSRGVGMQRPPHVMQ